MVREREMDFSMKCVKCLLFIANFMFALVGILLITVGTAVKSIYSTLDHFIEDHYYSASNLAIAVGFIIVFVGLFGCVGALRASVCLINTYALLLLCVLILELSVCVTSYALRSFISETVYYKMEDSMAYYNTYTKSTWDIVQRNLECCGVNGPEDWAQYADRMNFSQITEVYSKKNFTVPASCCQNDKCTLHYNYFYKSGCFHMITSIISESALLLGIAALCVSFVQIIGIVFAVLLAKSVRKLKTQKLVESTEAQFRTYDKMTTSPFSTVKTPVMYKSSTSEA